MQQPPHICLELRGVPLALREDRDIVDEQWYAFFHGLNVPVRWVTLTQPFNLDNAILAMRRMIEPLKRISESLRPILDVIVQGQVPTMALINQLPTDVAHIIDHVLDPLQTNNIDHWEEIVYGIAEAYPLWRIPLLEEYAEWYGTLVRNRESPLRRVRHFLLAFPENESEIPILTRELKLRLESAFRTSVWVSSLPSLFACAYKLSPKHNLVPENSLFPLWKILGTYDFRGLWSGGNHWEEIFKLPIANMAVAINIDPVSSRWSELRTSAVANDALDKEDDEVKGKRNRDARTRERGQVALQFEEMLQTGRQSLHQVQGFVAFAADTDDQLAEYEREIRTRLEQSRRAFLLDPRSVQATLAKLFSPIPAKSLSLSPVRRPYSMMSQQVANVIPAGVCSPMGTDGIMWGIDLNNDAPIFFEPFFDAKGDKTAAHMIGMGKTGVGKTFLLGHLLRRAAAAGARVVLVEPQSHAKRLIDSVNYGGDRAAKRFAITANDSLNPLDIVVHMDDDGRYPPISEQVEHVLGRISVLMGSDVTVMGADGNDRQTFRPKEWSEEQDAILSMALERVYQPFAHRIVDLSFEETPTLDAVITQLRVLVEEYKVGSAQCEQSEEMSDVAKKLIILFRSKLINQLGPIVNRTTTIRWDFDDYAVLAYGLDGLKTQRLKTYFFDHIFASINRYIRRPDRDRSVPIIVCFDEFAWSFSSIPTLLRFAANATKTWRTMRAALWVWDQDLHQYLGITDAQTNPDLKSVWENSTIRIIFKQGEEPARRLKDKLPYLTSDHMHQIIHATKGNYLLAWERAGNDDFDPYQVWFARMYSTPREQQDFTGS